MIKRGKGSWAVLTFMIWGTVAAAEPPTPMTSDQEFLEFLGGWELDDGTWVNPLDLLGPEDEQISDETMKERSNYKKLHNTDHDKPSPTPTPEPPLQP